MAAEAARVRRGRPPLLAVRILPPVVRAEGPLRQSRDSGHGRPAHLRGRRQRRRVEPSRAVRVDEDGKPAKVAGVPPDYFSATGQLWGNPIYRWDKLEETGYRVVDRADPGHARAGGYGPPGPLPRIRGLLGSAGRREDRAERALGEGAGCRRCSRALEAALGKLPDRRREPGRDHAGGGSDSRSLRLSRA